MDAGLLNTTGTGPTMTHSEHIVDENDQKESTYIPKSDLISVIRAHEQKKKNVVRDDEELGLSFEFYTHSVYNIDNTAQTFCALFEFKINRQLAGIPNRIFTKITSFVVFSRCHVVLWNLTISQSHILFIDDFSEQEVREYAEDPDGFTPKVFSFLPISAIELKQMEPHKFSDGNPYFIKCHEDDTVWVHELWLCNLTFAETMELERFPFDVQHYEMNLQLDARDIPNRFNHVHGTFIVDKTNLIGCDFESHGHQQLTLIEETEGHEGQLMIKFRAIFGVKRDWQFYALRVILILAIISFLSNLCFFFGDFEESMPERFGTISTSLLTTVAFIFIISEYIPPLKYLTFLDVYIYGTFGYIVLIAIENVALSVSDSLQEIENVDYVVAASNMVIWFLAHLLFGIQARKAINREMKKFLQFKQELDESDEHEKTVISSNNKRYDEVQKVGGERRHLRNKQK